MTGMSNIHAIHPLMTKERAQRLLDIVREAHSERKPLGSRASHIRALCHSLEMLLEQLRLSFTILISQLEEQKICTEKAKREFEIMTAQTYNLISMARACMSDDTKPSMD